MILFDVENLKHYNRHFIPQCYWLFHLFKYYKSEVTLLPFDTMLDWLPNRGGPPIKKISKQRRGKILSINFEKYVEADQRLLHRYLNKTVQLEKIIREFKNVLSAS